ncbi:MAG: KpsF/GutQ family sugar-phosphate isomerase [Deltaproteobacteria bacterium]|nr:KpsF/GutQ family sugar-phosphate isomerase [Deltaproteobacteria bacterium]
MPRPTSVTDEVALGGVPHVWSAPVKTRKSTKRRARAAFAAPKDNDARRRTLADARAVIDAEGQAVLSLLDRLDRGFAAAVEQILVCQGRVVVTGLGKSGIVGRKLSATLASTGTPSLFIHAAEAVHGDLGRMTPEDVVLAMSYSGESEEIIRLIRPVKALGATLIALTGRATSTLGRHADVVVSVGNVAEACPMGLVPTASTTAMLVMGDALAIALFNRRGLDREDYARFHPGGQLGRKLMKVTEVMRTGLENPIARDTASLGAVVAVMTTTPGRPGAASIVDKHGKLVGFFTDGDLRRLLSDPSFSVSVPIREVMHRSPKTVRHDQLMVEAEALLRKHKIDNVPVVDTHGRPIGLVVVQDLLSTRVV